MLMIIFSNECFRSVRVLTLLKASFSNFMINTKWNVEALCHTWTQLDI